MRSTLTLLYGVVCYILFLVAFLYAIAFVADLPVPRTVDGPVVGGRWALWIDLALLALFAVQHSGMARPGFKRWLTGWMSPALERSTYVLLTSLALFLLYWQWRPLTGLVWDVGDGWARWLLYLLAAVGWLLVLTGTFVINHFDLFGLRQVWLRARGRPYTELQFKQQFYYRLIRHPLMLGFIVAFWAAPRMTVGHLLFAAVTTAYIVLAVKLLEERDLVAMHGEAYRRYQREVPMLCPWPRPRARAGTPAAPSTGAGPSAGSAV
ncbi:MAG TPA: NnrU family protein [Rhodanobacteraceae bacterium]|nr:NnrU family protein [Rhodanobacteraceae bacterium]